MNTAIVAATIVLLIQGIRIVIRPGAAPYVRCFGALTLLLAGLSLILFAILFWGEAVLSPEFDVVMARGHWRGLVTLVIGFAVAAGLGLHVQRLKADLPGRLAGLLFLGLAVGTAAAMRITRLPMGPGVEDAAQPFWIYSYDLWWPPLLIWLSACFLDGAITILGVRDRRVRTGMFLAMLLVLSWRAQGRQAFTDPRSADLWSLAFYLAALGSLLLVLWLLWSASIGFAGALPRLRAAARGALPAALRQWDRAMTDGWPGISAHVWHGLQPMAGQLLAVLALATIAGSLADIFYLAWLPHAGALVVLAIAWTCLAEVTAQGPLRAFVVNVVPEVYAALARQESWLRQAWLLLSGHFAGPLSRLGAALRRLVSLRPFPEALMKIGVLLVVMMVAYEVPHAGKTLLQPFTAFAVNVKSNAAEVPTVSLQPDIGRALFDHLVNMLGALTVELQPDVILLLPPDPERGARFRTLAAGGAGSIDLFLTQGTDIDLGGVKVPVGFLLTPVLQPVRWLLGVRVVNGSVLADAQGYTVLVRSSSGEMWRARLANQDVPQDASGGDGTAARSGPDQAFSRLSLELAFQIMSAEPALATFGMTRSWEAFEHFNRGLAHWRTFALHRELGDPDALSEAIQRFRKATAIDPGFALAHYRLGVALSNDGQPLAGAEALRASLKANPGFVPAMIALASVLYSSEQDSGALLIGSPKTPGDSMGTTRLQEARRLWQSVISVTSGASSLDRAAAWAGLCRHALDEPDPRQQGPERDAMPGQYDERDSLYRIAYFYCQQAERLYVAHVTTPREDLRVRTARASELAAIGMLLERHGPRRRGRPTPDWQCSRAGIDEAALASDGRTVSHRVPVSYYTTAALGYYRQALKLLPDDPVLRCHEASAEFAASGHDRLMKALKDEAASRWNLAESYRAEARRHLALAGSRDARVAVRTDRTHPDRQWHATLAAAYFGHALTEYRETQKRDPTSFEALNRYAHVFWEWRHAEANTPLPDGPGLEHGRVAESSARRAIAVIKAKSVSQEGDADPGPPAARPDPAVKITPATLADPARGTSSGMTASALRVDSVPRHLRPAATTAYASLGAVLIAQMRPHEAIEELESVQRHVPEHPSFDSVRWMLAQAHLCAASQAFRAMRAESRAEPRTDETARSVGSDPRREAIDYHREKARPPLDIIRDHERSREAPAFAGLTDISRSDRMCRADWLSAAMERGKYRVRYALKQIESTNHRRLCRWQGVRMQPPADWTEEDEPLFLHVWGGSVDERVPVNGIKRDAGARPDRLQRQDPIPIAWTHKPSYYYFAQLEDGAQLPLSMPVALTQTSAEDRRRLPSPANAAPVVVAAAPASGGTLHAESETSCPNVMNLIQLTFKPIASAVAHTVSDD